MGGWSVGCWRALGSVAGDLEVSLGEVVADAQEWLVGKPDDRVRQAAEAFCQLSQMENPFPHGLLSLNVEPAVKCRDKNLRGHDSGCRKVSALSAREFSVVHFAENANVVVLLKVWPGRRIVEGNSGRWTESG